MLPVSTKIQIDAYVDQGVPPGDFLYAVLTSNLFEAAMHTDAVNGPNLSDICMYIYNYTPAVCWGSVEKVEAWLKLHREDPAEAVVAASYDKKTREEYYERHVG